MGTSRRDFLKAAGFTALGASGAVPVIAAGTARAQSLTRRPAPEAMQGKHWALFVDSERCARHEDCHACMDACHVIHNVPHIEDHEEEIKWIWKDHAEHVFHGSVSEHTSDELKHREVPVLCNHCDNPPCVRVCPTQATWKRDDGPVMMDQHRCIGCRYCVVGCPYGARSFNFQDPRPHIDEVNRSFPTRTKGVVEKCTLCAERLSREQIPACVEACQGLHGEDAPLVFGDLNDPESRIRQIVGSSWTARRKAELGTRPQVYYSL